jgi:protein-serine/threonine kinase
MTALAAPAYDLTFGEVDDDWTWPAKPPLPRASTSGSYGYGVTVIGKGFEWNPTADKDDDKHSWPYQEVRPASSNTSTPTQSFIEPDLPARFLIPSNRPPPQRAHTSSVAIHRTSPVGYNHISPMIATPRARPPGGAIFTTSPIQSPMSSRPTSPSLSTRSPLVMSPNISRPTTPRPRRRSSQQRVSLIAGRLSLLPASDPPARPDAPQRLIRSGSARSFLSVASSAGPPTPNELREEFLTGRTVSEFVIEREIGRGAYGLVKRAREMEEDGTMGVGSSPYHSCSLFSPFLCAFNSLLSSSNRSSRPVSSPIAGRGIPSMVPSL